MTIPRLPFRPVQTVDEVSFVIGPASEVEVDIRTGRPTRPQLRR